MAGNILVFKYEWSFLSVIVPDGRIKNISIQQWDSVCPFILGCFLYKLCKFLFEVKSLHLGTNHSSGSKCWMNYRILHYSVLTIKIDKTIDSSKLPLTIWLLNHLYKSVEPGSLQSKGLQTIRDNWATKNIHTYMANTCVFLFTFC